MLRLASMRYSKEKKQTVAENKYGNRTEENTKFRKQAPELSHNNSLRLETRRYYGIKLWSVTGRRCWVA